MKSLTFIMIAFAAVFVFTFCSADNKAPDTKEAAIKRIAKAVDSGIGWAKNKDLDLLFNVIYQDSSYLSVHPTDKVVRGFEEFKKSVPIWMSPNFKYVRHELKDLTISISQSGDAAWFYCNLDDLNTWKGQPANWENVRWTGVLENREGRWIIVQQHFSFAEKYKIE